MSEKVMGADENPFGHGNSVVDTRSAILLDNTNVVMLENPSDGRSLYGLELMGRVNRSSARSSVLYLVDADGVAAIVTELLGLMSRAGDEEFIRLFDERLDKLPRPPKPGTS